ncbi:uncharacterized protein LOC144797698 [Lissotriton helveticus]
MRLYCTVMRFGVIFVPQEFDFKAYRWCFVFWNFSLHQSAGHRCKRLLQRRSQQISHRFKSGLHLGAAPIPDAQMMKLPTCRLGTYQIQATILQPWSSLLQLTWCCSVVHSAVKLVFASDFACTVKGDSPPTGSLLEEIFGGQTWSHFTASHYCKIKCLD